MNMDAETLDYAEFLDEKYPDEAADEMAYLLSELDPYIVKKIFQILKDKGLV